MHRQRGQRRIRCTKLGRAPVPRAASFGIGEREPGGGGAKLHPGEISRARGGMLFLDELPEFDRRVLEALREPLGSGVITLSRVAGTLHLPAGFQQVAAMNP